MKKINNVGSWRTVRPKSENIRPNPKSGINDRAAATVRQNATKNGRPGMNNVRGTAKMMAAMPAPTTSRPKSAANERKYDLVEIPD
jgi:hypothetical protein